MVDLEAAEAAYPKARTCPFSAPPEYARLREEEPVSKVPMLGGGTAWLVTRHEDVRKVLTDTRMSADRRRPGFPQLAAGRNFNSNMPSSMIWMDPPEHTAARRAVLGEFTMRRTEALRSRVQQIVDDCIEEILAAPHPVDLVTSLSLPVPSLVICELIGVPYADHDFFQSRTNPLFHKNTSQETRMRMGMEMRSFLSDLVSAKKREPTDDVLGRQIRKQLDATGEVDHAAMVSLAFLLLVAGHETTANMISLGVLALLENPDKLAEIVADPTRTPAAVEELLRYFTIIDAGTSRVALEDVEIGGELIREGEGVVALALAANRDPEVFEQPDELDLSRNARGHVAFGFGAHQCLGQNLARMELQIVFDTLFRRLPGLRLAVPVEDLPFKHESNIYGIYELPVTWGGK